MPPQMRQVFSSFVDSIGYDHDTGELHVEHRATKRGMGSTAVYEGVPSDIADRVINSASIGEALHAFVRGKYTHRII